MIEHVERRSSQRQAQEPAKHPIPPMIDKLGRHWDQPPRERITVDDKTATMTLSDFKELATYSGTYPSGVYDGKMWRRHNGAHDYEFRARGGKPEWMLCWFGPSEKSPNYCATFMRKIILSDADIDQQK